MIFTERPLGRFSVLVAMFFVCFMLYVIPLSYTFLRSCQQPSCVIYMILLWVYTNVHLFLLEFKYKFLKNCIKLNVAPLSLQEVV